MSVLVERPDLSKRTALSKSALVAAELCGHKAFYDIHDRRFIPTEKTVFGSALDGAMEVAIGYFRIGQPADLDVAAQAAWEVLERPENADVDMDRDAMAGEVVYAVRGFAKDAAHHYDWEYVQTQLSLSGEMEGLGEVDGHPDIRFRNGDVADVKSASKSKPDDRSVELGFYGVLCEALTGEAVPRVGYLTFVRSRRIWQELWQPFTDEYRRWAVERAAAYIRAKRADVALNAKSPVPVNWSFGAGPKFQSLCSDCAYNPALGGACPLAYRAEASDDAA